MSPLMYKLISLESSKEQALVFLMPIYIEIQKRGTFVFFDDHDCDLISKTQL